MSLGRGKCQQALFPPEARLEQGALSFSVLTTVGIFWLVKVTAASLLWVHSAIPLGLVQSPSTFLSGQMMVFRPQ